MSATSDTTVNINTILTFLESIKQENSDDLVNSRGINKINTMIESMDSDLLKKEIKEKITIVDYENALANVYEKIATKSSASNKIEDCISDLQASVPIRYLRVGRAYKYDRFFSIILYRIKFYSFWNSPTLSCLY